MKLKEYNNTRSQNNDACITIYWVRMWAYNNIWWECPFPRFVGHHYLSTCNVCQCGLFMATVTGEASVILCMVCWCHLLLRRVGIRYSKLQVTCQALNFNLANHIADYLCYILPEWSNWKITEELHWQATCNPRFSKGIYLTHILSLYKQGNWYHYLCNIRMTTEFQCGNSLTHVVCRLMQCKKNLTHTMSTFSNSFYCS